MVQDALFQCSIDIYLIKVTHMEWNESAPLVVQNVVTPLSSLHRSICDGVHDIPSAVRALMDKHFVEEEDWEKIDISVVDIMGSTILSQGSYQSSSSSPSLQETYQEKPADR